MAKEFTENMGMLARHEIAAEWNFYPLMGMLYNQFFIAVRSLQDNLYGLLTLLMGNTPGRKGMKQCMDNARNPVHRLIVPSIPGYRDWFFNMRDLRNAMKTGIPTTGGSTLTTGGEVMDFSVCFHIPAGSDVNIPIEVTFDDLQKAIRMSHEVVSVVTMSVI